MPEIQMQHDAFLVDGGTFGELHARLREEAVEHWADPRGTLPGRVNTHHRGHGVYFKGPAGHGFEVTRHPYGSSM